MLSIIAMVTEMEAAMTETMVLHVVLIHFIALCSHLSWYVKGGVQPKEFFCLCLAIFVM